MATSLLLGTSLLAPAMPAAATPHERSEQRTQLTLLATTDLHGRLQNWDYFKDAPYSDRFGNTVGLSAVSSVVDGVRGERGAESVIVVDNGDFLQGTPLTTYYAKQQPVTQTGAEHPMATGYNAIGYDAQAPGNHEFDYGLDLLDAYVDDADFPVLAANVIDTATGEPLLQPYTVVTKKLGNKPVKVGILGLTTPGSMIWNKGHLEGKVTIEDMVTSARKWVPQVKAAGADVVVVLSHAGIGLSSYDTSTGLGEENPSDQIAEQVPGIDVMVIGHTHRTDAAERFITNEVTGEEVLLTQPMYWGQSVSDVTIDLQRVRGKWDVTGANAEAILTSTVAEDPAVVAATDPAHETTIDYVNTVIAQSVTELPATESRYRDTAIIDYIQMVQTQTVEEATAGGQYADLPVLSIAAPFSRTAVFPEGDVTIRDMAGLYIYDNTLEAVVLTGSQVKDFLEYSAKYFGTVAPGETFDPETDTSVVHQGQQVWDYNYDIIAGVDYEIDLSQPVGSRIENLTHADGTAVAADDQFVVAVNNYRRSGGGNFPHISTAPVVYNEMQEIRQLLIDWAVERGTIDPADFFDENWTLTVDGARVP
ncbi:5'-nucleotidase C-terminal domain-containing protein [Tessaracoccus sp. OS52]|uniref:bifunctional metallophosphatase/5'-nucleotidase n=1 Tax=Tessaracoccus sp. OS52 TaxID=2886691 RepID=UPI001D12927E|nr:5'-nucleotidase C-terminal domain-containing protein [Tessaracoccus sp. OS52]MCC2593611.1 5'-nucleotidase C-terminal domain-containing protein [Tessaracoccus sp. OS52]